MFFGGTSGRFQGLVQSSPVERGVLVDFVAEESLLRVSYKVNRPLLVTSARPTEYVRWVLINSTTVLTTNNYKKTETNSKTLIDNQSVHGRYRQLQTVIVNGDEIIENVTPDFRQ